MRKIFVGPDGLRAGWRFALFVALWVAISTGFLVVARSGYQPHPGMHPIDFVLSDGLGVVTIFIVLAILGRIEGRPIDTGLRLSPGFAGRFSAGLIWGLAPVAATMAVIALLGGVSFSGWALSGAELARMTSLWIAMMAVLGLFEESLFRGYPLATLARGMGRWPAAILLSVLFGGLHYVMKPMETLYDALSVTLIGLFLCFTIFRTGDLWLAVGFHAAFDFFALAFFGAPNTGNGGRPLDGHLLATRFEGPVWLTGGPCGIEASAVMIAVTVLMFPAFSRLHTAKDSAVPAGSRPATAEA